MIDQPGSLREADRFNAEAVKAFVQQQVPGIQGDMKVRQFKGGASNLTYQLDFENARFILRTSPSGTKAKSAHDMGREYRIMQQLKPVFSTVPDMIAFCKDEGLIGREFYIMQKLEGIIPRANLPKGLQLNESDVRSLCTNVIDKLVELHKVNYTQAGLEDLGKGAGYVQRQINGWCDRYEKARTPNVPSCKKVMDWLKSNMPQDVATCIIHGDFRFDNVVLASDEPTRVIGVLDWEMATLGDPLMDLGNSLAYWVEAADPLPLRITRRQPTHLKGMLTRQEVVNYYCDKMGFGKIDFTFYRIYGLFRLAVIVQQIYYRYYHQQTDNPQFKNFNLLVSYLDLYCEELLAKSWLDKWALLPRKMSLYFQFALSSIRK
ncbi:MAG: phosphotransferase family protein [Bacteroidetes bacterium]|nr:phosphotransferase family protein [Bacteroidota bacterium]